jgi:hypothetical protein
MRLAVQSLSLGLCFSGVARAAPTTEMPPIAANRTWDALAPNDDLRQMLVAAAEGLGPWTIDLAGQRVDASRLRQLAHDRPEIPITRVAREALRLPVDLVDLLYFVDDLIVAGRSGRGGLAVLPAGRARSEGVLLHPDDVFEDDEAREYPRSAQIAIDAPAPQQSFDVPPDGALLGPEWTMRYRSETEPAAMYYALAMKRPASGFASKIAALVSQLEQQGADVYLTAFMRHRERGYLMWGAALLRACQDEKCVEETLSKLEDRRVRWELSVPITWPHPSGWQATQEAARRMADAFEVVFVTEKGARDSNHYDGEAADFVVMGMPAIVTLWAPDGAHRTFDLSGPDEPRDLSLTPAMIDWIEEHYSLRKIENDHPHWDEACSWERDGCEP